MLEVSIYWPWFPYCARQAGKNPGRAWTYSMIRQVLQQNVYGRRVYLIGFSDPGGFVVDPRYDILRQGGVGMRGLELSAQDIAVQTGQEQRTVERHLAKLGQSGELVRLPVDGIQARPIWLKPVNEIIADNYTRVPLWLYVACGQQVALAVFVAYVVKWLNRGRTKFHRSWSAIAKDTGLSRDTVRRMAYEAQRLNFIGISAATLCDHWFWIEDGLAAAMRESVHDYCDWVRARKRHAIDTRKAPEHEEPATEFRNRIQQYAAQGLPRTQSTQKAKQRPAIAGDQRLKIVHRPSLRDIYWLETGKIAETGSRRFQTRRQKQIREQKERK